MGNWDGFDMQAELHPGFVPDACVAEVPGQPMGPVQDLRKRCACYLFMCYRVFCFKLKSTKSRQMG